MATIITKNSTTPGNTPGTIIQGELAINTADGKLFYGSGSVAKEFTASLATTASYVTGSIFNSTNPVLSASYALTASYAFNSVPGDGNTTIQFNDAGAFSGSGNFTFNKTTNTVKLSGSLNFTGSLLATQSYISKVDYIDYTVDPGTLAHSEGRTYWDVDRKTLQIDTDVNNFTISAGHVSVLRGRNTNSFTLTKGMVVYINGNSGQFATFTSASWENDPSSAYTIGLIAQDINPNQFGYAVTDGEITGVNTNGFAPATLLYLSSSGQYTGTKPVAPRHTVRLGQVVVSSTNGILQVKIDNGYELGELHDVVDNTTTSSFGDLLVKSGSVWHNSRQLTGSYSITGSLQATSFTGSLQGTSSWAVSASQALTASYIAPAGSNFQIQYNNNGTLGATGSFRFNYNSQSLAQGFNVTASGVYSHAEGDGARAIGIYSHAEGRNTQAIGDYSHAEGRSALATGVASHAEGLSTQTIGEYSHAEGASTQASGSYSHAEGTGTQAIGDASHAEGASTQAIGNFSHAEGTGTQAIGRSSHAEGENTKAIGERSHAEGYNTKSGYKGFNSNDIGTTTPGDIYLNSSYGDVSALFVVGQFIILSDIDDDNNYGTIKLEIASSFFDGINTVITLVDTSIATSAASIGVFDDPEPPGADQIYIGWYSHAEGELAQAIGWYSHAEGSGTKAIGDSSHAEGTSTQAIGYVSHAEGFETIASGSQSHAEGEQTIAIGAGSHAEGKDTIAIGNSSHAEGQETQAIGDWSHAEGYATKAIGYYSHAEGADTQAIGDYSHAEGDSTQAIGLYSHVEGQETQAIGDYSHAEGYNTQASGSYSHAEGRGATASGPWSHAEGDSTQAIGEYSHAEGSGTQATGDYSHAEGYQAVASGSYSHAEGETTTASGIASHAEGLTTIASGDYSHAEGGGSVAQGIASHAEGENTQAIGNFSHAEGNSAQAIGDYSHAEGLGTVTSGSYQHAQGQYNLSSSAQSAFIIGNGVDTNNRSNLVFASGSDFQITGSLRITGSAFVVGLTNTSQTDVLTYNSTTGQVFFTASSAIGGSGGVSGTGADTLVAYWSGSTVVTGSAGFFFNNTTNTLTVPSFIESSAQRFKTNILPLTNSLENVQKLKGVSFNRIDGNNRKELGLIADEVEKIYPELVSYDNDGQIHGLQYPRITALLIESIKELSQQVHNQQIFINELKNRIEKLENNGTTTIN